MSGSRRRTRDDVGMDLFPFMAVLICTMGSLIMLLVVMVQQARVRATTSVVVATVDPNTATQHAAKIAAQTAAKLQAAQDYASQKIAVEKAQENQTRQLEEHEKNKQLAEQKQIEIDDLKWKAEALRPSYEKTAEDVANRRLALSHLEQHTRELSEQAAKMQAEADLIAQKAKNSSTLAFAQDLERINTQLAAAKRELDAEKKKFAEQKTKYALVPYDGPSGTTRPPIYIECLPDRVVLQPENVVLIGEDFREPLSQSNPLAIALRAKREFMLKNGLLPKGAEPYPLLVVRPGAAGSYAAARSAMTAWEAEFGYELVENDIELAYRPKDKRLAELLNDLVIEARGRRRMFRSARPRQRKQPELLRPSASGGFETVPNGTSSYVGGSGGDEFGDGDDPFGSGGEFSNGKSSNNFGSDNQNRQEAGNRFDGDGDAFSTGSANSNGFGSGAGTQEGGSQNDGSKNGGSQNDSSGFDPNMPLPPDGTRDAGQFPSNGKPPSGPGGDSRFGTEGVTASGGGGGSSTTASGSGGQGADGSGGTGGASGQRSNAASAGSTGFSSNQSLAQSRGTNWALSGVGDAVGIKRPIQIVCDQDRLVLIPEKGSRDELQIFRHHGSVPGVVDPFVDAVQSRLKSWGFAGQGIYWRPVLQVKVQGLADSKYRQLRQLLDRSGIEVTREP